MVCIYFNVKSYQSKCKIRKLYEQLKSDYFVFFIEIRMGLSKDSKDTLGAMTSAVQFVVHYGYIPFIIYLGML